MTQVCLPTGHYLSKHGDQVAFNRTFTENWVNCTRQYRLNLNVLFFFFFYLTIETIIIKFRKELSLSLVK